MFDTSIIELSASALQYNLRFIKKKLKPGVRYCSVVKGNAYGHGVSQFVQMAMDEGIDYFALYSAEEAFLLKKQLYNIPELFIMGAIENEAIEWTIKNNIEFSVFDFERLEIAKDYSKKMNIRSKIHIEIETGMRRTGFAHTDFPKLFKWFRKNGEHVILQGVFTHFAGAESRANHFRVSNQINNFELTLKMFEDEGLRSVYQHSTCSAALLNYPETQKNMVRIGILQYGYWPNKETHVLCTGEKDNLPVMLKRIIRWTSKVMSVKEVKKGCFIGYGTAYLANKNTKIAVIPVGYSHGFSRNLSNVGSVLINGKIAPVIGTVNMNSLSVDVTGIENVNKGDEVVLIGKQNGKAITVSSFSEQSNQLNYELLTRLHINIPRIVVK
ncbi:MAG TPA: alanine racemase [Ignavibacteria bacterium]|nr:alanine racemase [Ignavibacteria bacterium]